MIHVVVHVLILCLIPSLFHAQTTGNLETLLTDYISSNSSYCLQFTTTYGYTRGINYSITVEGVKATDYNSVTCLSWSYNLLGFVVDYDVNYLCIPTSIVSQNLTTIAVSWTFIGDPNPLYYDMYYLDNDLVTSGYIGASSVCLNCAGTRKRSQAGLEIALPLPDLIANFDKLCNNAVSLNNPNPTVVSIIVVCTILNVVYTINNADVVVSITTLGTTAQYNCITDAQGRCPLILASQGALVVCMPNLSNLLYRYVVLGQAAVDGVSGVGAIGPVTITRQGVVGSHGLAITADFSQDLLSQECMMYLNAQYVMQIATVVDKPNRAGIYFVSSPENGCYLGNRGFLCQLTNFQRVLYVAQSIGAAIYSSYGIRSMGLSSYFLPCFEEEPDASKIIGNAFGIFLAHIVRDSLLDNTPPYMDMSYPNPTYNNPFSIESGETYFCSLSPYVDSARLAALFYDVGDLPIDNDPPLFLFGEDIPAGNYLFTENNVNCIVDFLTFSKKYLPMQLESPALIIQSLSAILGNCISGTMQYNFS